MEAAPRPCGGGLHKTSHFSTLVVHVRPARSILSNAPEFLPLRNRGLGALAVTRPATSPIFVTATPTCALSQARPLLWLARRAGAQDFARSTRARACLTPRLPRNH